MTTPQGGATPGGAPRQGQPGPAGQAPMWQPARRGSFWLTFLTLLLINYLLINWLFPSEPSYVTIPYTVFKEQVVAGNVAAITSRGEDIQGDFRQPVVADEGESGMVTLSPAPEQPAEGQQVYTEFATIKPALIPDPELINLLEGNEVVITAEPLEQARSPLWNLLLAFGPTLLLIGGFLWLSSRALRSAGGAGGAGGPFGLGRSRARRYDPAAVERVNFDDVAGIDEVENELVELVDFLKNPAKYEALGAMIPRGVLLEGPPGTGKTLLARAVAGEADVPFFSMSGSEFIEMVVGVGASRVRDLFKEARSHAPSIIFIDEIDAIGRRRGGNELGGNDEREQTLNQILTEMDGFGADTRVVVLGATNRADVLDPALLRPGRFDRRVVVQPPDKAGRTEILKIHTRGVPLAPDVDLERIAANMPGATGAELRNLVNEASLTAARRGNARVTMRDFADAMEKLFLGAERRILLRPEDRERVAYHEAGHALLGLVQPESDPVRRVTIVPRAQALGVTLSMPEDDRYNYTEEYLRARIVTTLGGRAAELVVYGNVTTGAENDLQQVTGLAQAMVMRFGMSAEVGQVQLIDSSRGNYLGAGLTQRPYSEATAQAADRAVRKIVDESYQKAIRLLNEHRARLDALTQALLAEETLDEARILQVTGLAPHVPPAAAEAVAG
ncbi:MAG TPA: ATP-dependent zinc metalloprotease FtsH [Chloroflexaceae bacterium]|nr:ATP-dependent zinc metalloprotease FtsH [Chloroflexaceae bacterium]